MPPNGAALSPVVGTCVFSLHFQVYPHFARFVCHLKRLQRPCNAAKLCCTVQCSRDLCCFNKFPSLSSPSALCLPRLLAAETLKN